MIDCVMRNYAISMMEIQSRRLAVLTPALIGPAYFREMVAVLAGGGPPDPARVAEVMRRHGLIVVPPAGTS